MASHAEAPIEVTPIPPQVIHESAKWGPFDLTRYIQSPNEVSGPVTFSAELSNGDPLPKGLICTGDGILSGIAALGTKGTYEVVIKAENLSGLPFTKTFSLTILEALFASAEVWTNLKSQVWEALGKNLPVPEMADVFNRPITAVEIYYLLQRFATLTIWDVYNIETPSEKQIIHLEGENPHYVLYDRGCCIIGAPKDLYSHERTLEDALQTARVMAREVYKRGWTIEFAGFDKMVRAAWVELQILKDKFGREIDVLHYQPSLDDVKIYSAKSADIGLGPF